MEPMATQSELRVLVLAPLGRDAQLTVTALQEASISCCACRDIDELCAEIAGGAAAAIIAEEAFTDQRVSVLQDLLSGQPTWSDFPIIFLTSGAGSAIETRTTGEALALLGNVQLLERPTRVGTLLSVVRSALRARKRQYQNREYLREQERVELALRRSEAQLTFALEAAEFGAWDLELQTGRMWRSSQYDQIMGFAEAPADWTYLRFLEHVHPGDRARVNDAFERALAIGEPWTFECRVIRADGKERWIWVEGDVQRAGKKHNFISALRRRDDGQMQSGDLHPGGPRMIGLMRDITERKITEEILARRTEELARSNAELQDFAYISSHDLKEPLRGISNYARFLLDDEGDRLSEEGRERLRTLIRLSQRMYSLLDSLLDYSRVGRTRLKVEEIDMNAVVADVVDSMKGWLDEQDAKVSTSGSLPTIRCDRVRTGQVLTNLIANAVKYNTSDSKEVQIGSWIDEQGEAIVFVRDNGIGIPARHQQTIFKMFRRLHARDTFGGGTGAGLALVKRIIEHHGGRIWVESTPGTGSTFYFSFGECQPVMQASPSKDEIATR